MRANPHWLTSGRFGVDHAASSDRSLKLDVDANRDTAVKYGIQAIPTLLLVNDGEIADRIVGVTDKASLTSKLESLL
jgi:thioredoxin-like negative regulator of GroEL